MTRSPHAAIPRSRTFRLAALSAALTTSLVGSVLSAAPAPAAPKTPGAPTATSTAQEAVIVTLKDQLTSRPATASHLKARQSAAHSDQQAVLSRLSGAKPTKVINYTLGNAFAATVSGAQAVELAADPAVASVIPDRSVSVPAGTGAQAGAAAQASPKSRLSTKAAAAPDAVDPRACSSDPAKPKLEPEALQTMNVRSEDSSAKTAAALGIDGSGVKVAYIADGINPANAGFKRTDGSSSVVDYKDFYGDGPSAPGSGAEAFGDASAISAQGNVTYDVADYANPNVVSFPDGHCYIKIVGVAPGADVVGLKAGSELLPNSAILQSIDYAVSVAKVNVINESFGGNVYPDNGARNTIALFNDNAVKAGVAVVASTGDAGVTSTIGSPATDPNVISAGASTDSRIYEQTGYALATKFGNGTWQNSNISSLSSAGITQDGRTIDISAPGEADWAVCDDSGNWSGCTSFGNTAHPYSKIQSFGGTSQSSPFTAGVAALVIQAYKKTHGGTGPTPAQIKTIITSTARDLGLRGDEQGSGLIDARAAVEAALTWPGANSSSSAANSAANSPAKANLSTKAAASSSTTTTVGQNIAVSSNQLTLTGRPGRNVSGTVQVRNVGTKAQTIASSTRRSVPLSLQNKTVAIDTSSSQTLAYPTTGAPWVYQKFTFTVPSGADELSSVIRWPGKTDANGVGPVVRLSVIAPDGAYAGNTRPQGGTVSANYGLITVRRPAAGTWTGILYTPAKGGFTGDVTATNETFRSLPVGSVSPSTKTLQPGATADVRVRVPVPSVGGDTVDTVSIGSSGGHQVAVPVIVRSLVRAKDGGEFAGTITGGNARGASPAQTFSYNLQVPKGKRDVRVAVSLADDPKYRLAGVLIDPNGEVQSISSNFVSGTQGRSLQNTVAAPQAGRWRYVVVVQGPVPGTKFSEDFTGELAFNQVKAKVSKLPSSIVRNQTVNATVKVTNTGPAPMLVQTDARLNTYRNQQLAPLGATSTIDLPLDVENLVDLPAYLVPPDTTRVALTASSTTPAQVELSSPAFGIDVFGDLSTAKDGSTISTAKVSESTGNVGPGFWTTYVQQIGPFDDSGAPAGSSVLSGTARTKVFDPAVTSSVGDPFLAAVDPTADSGEPAVIDPGTSKTITVKITPTGAKGSKVSGVLHLVTGPGDVGNSFNPTGEVLANVPYSYTVR